MMKKNTLLWVVGVIVLIAGLFVWGRLGDANKEVIGQWASIGVNCLPNGHQNLGQHIHQTLKILVDGKEEIIPKDVGVTATCLSELHTHDIGGEIHVETVKPGITFTLGQFFSILGKEIERPGFALKMTVSGVPSTEYGKLVLTDKQEILLQYSPIAEGTETVSIEE